MTTTEVAPLFGTRTQDPTRVPFRLMAYYSDGTEVEHPFTARAEVDASTALAAARGGSDGRDAAYIEKFLIRTLVDDDGVSRRDEPVPVQEDGEPGTELAIRADLHTGDWEIGGETFPSRSLALQYADGENGSSLRRFARLMDDPFATVHIDALRQILEYIVEKSGRRPTAPSRRSQPRRTQKPRR